MSTMVSAVSVRLTGGEFSGTKALKKRFRLEGFSIMLDRNLKWNSQFPFIERANHLPPGLFFTRRISTLSPCRMLRSSFPPPYQSWRTLAVWRTSTSPCNYQRIEIKLWKAVTIYRNEWDLEGDEWLDSKNLNVLGLDKKKCISEKFVEDKYCWFLTWKFFLNSFSFFWRSIWSFFSCSWCLFASFLFFFSAFTRFTSTWSL